MKDAQQTIELYEYGNHFMRVGDRIAHMGDTLRRQTDGTEEAIIQKFEDDAEAVRKGLWDLNDWEADGGIVESFEEWEQRTCYDKDGYIKNADAPDLIASAYSGRSQT